MKVEDDRAGFFARRIDKHDQTVRTKACFIRRTSVASNAIQTIDNEMLHLVIYCLNCIRRD